MDKIIPNGTTVEIIGTEIKGKVISAQIEGIDVPLISYKVTWWAGGTRLSDWLETSEINIYVDTSKKAGMVNYETEPSKLIE